MAPRRFSAVASILLILLLQLFYIDTNLPFLINNIHIVPNGFWCGRTVVFGMVAVVATSYLEKVPSSIFLYYITWFEGQYPG